MEGATTAEGARRYRQEIDKSIIAFSLKPGIGEDKAIQEKAMLGQIKKPRPGSLYHV